MRSIWQGHIRFSLVTIPIRLYNAVDSAESVSFNLLHKKDSGRIGYEKKCKKCGKSVDQDEIVKGFEYEPDQYVVMEPEDLASVKLKSTRVIEIEGFIDSSEVDPMLYEDAYFAGPDGAIASNTYALLSETLTKTGRVGIGRVILRDREDVVLIAPLEKGLILHRLREPKEMRELSDVPGIDEPRKVTAAELKLATSLVEQLSSTLSNIDLTDQYEEAIKEVIKAKIDGKEVVTSVEDAPPVVDLMSALKASLEEAKRLRKPMVKARGSATKSSTAADKSGAKKSAEKKPAAKKTATKKPAAKKPAAKKPATKRALAANPAATSRKRKAA